ITAPSTTDLYTLSLHDALPIWLSQHAAAGDLEHDVERHLALALRARHRDNDRVLRRHRRQPGKHRADPEEARRAEDQGIRLGRMRIERGDIELAGVCKSYDGVVNAVDGVNLRIADGAYCCFIGPSGCGKTTI